MYRKMSAFLIISICIATLSSGCGGSSYNNKEKIISNENSYTYRKCNDAGSTDNSLKSEYPFVKYVLFVIVMSISVYSGTPRTAEK